MGCAPFAPSSFAVACLPGEGSKKIFFSQSASLFHRLALLFPPTNTNRRRAAAWPLLLGIYAWGSTAEQRNVLRRSIRETYESLCRQMEGSQFASEEDIQQFKQQCDALVIDVTRADQAYDAADARRQQRVDQLTRILKAYVFLHRYPGYVQGMSGVSCPVAATAKPFLFLAADLDVLSVLFSFF